MREVIEWLNNLAEKWQREWFSNKIYEADPDNDKPKFFVTAAFPYPNSPVHIGNVRSFLLADIMARYMRLKGYNTLYPMGFHYTGTPILTMAEAIAKKDPELIDLFKDLYRVPDEEIERMRDPLALARYFHRVSRESMKRLGLGIDWRREFTTIDPEFQSFIRWQFKKLFDKKYLIRGTYPVGWCPLHQMPVGGHDTKDDKDPEIGEFTLIFFKDDKERIFPTATLRPETIFAVTNLWVNPEATYAEINVEGDIWILSKRAYEKIIYQKDNVELIRELRGSELEGVIVENPITGEKVPVISALFVDPNFGTGVVMSVPSHSIDDYVAYREVIKERSSDEIIKRILTPRKIIDVPGISDLPAKWFAEKYNVRSSLQRDLLEKLTRELYTLEYNTGKMFSNLDQYVEDEKIRIFVREKINGESVSIARENISSFLRSIGRGDVFYEIMNAPVYCRCGTEIVVKILKDQWFINYGDPEWKERGLEALDNMFVVPEEAKRHMKSVIENLREKPCARTRGLGTPLPWDPTWIIESLSDSTIYMAFYTVVHKIREYGISADKLDEEFWDYVLLGLGDVRNISRRVGVDPEKIIDIRKEFLYWYPLDLRVAGKDLSNNHLPFFIMNHVAIFPRELWPKSMLVHGWVLREGEKMSKSKRNITPVFRAIEEKGSDTVRVVLSLSSEIDQDLDYRDAYASSVALHLKRIFDLVKQLSSKKTRDDPSRRDLYYLSRISRKLLKADQALSKMRIREAGNIIIYEIPNDLQTYLSDEEIWSDVLVVAKEWIKYLSIYASHLSEEIWREIFMEESYVSKEIINLNNIMRYINVKLELEEEYLRSLVDDIQEIINVAKITPRRIVIYVADPGEYALIKSALRHSLEREGLKEFINEYINRISEKERPMYVSRLRRIYENALKLSSEMRELIDLLDNFDEFNTITNNIDFIKKIFSVDSVEIYRADDPLAKDLGGKKKLALPMRPSIYIE